VDREERIRTIVQLSGSAFSAAYITSLP